MLSCGTNVNMQDQVVSVEAYVIMWELMLSCGNECYHLGRNVIMCYHVRPIGICGNICYHVGANVIMWEQMLSSGKKYYQTG